MSRTFESKPAVRENVPLLVGLVGPSGSGKTYSALELATGIQSVVGGEIFVIDTEAKRALHYADIFRFQHVPFVEPFGSLDYLESFKQCAAKGAKIIVVDSMSHEHESPGGMLDVHEKEVERLSKGDAGKADRVNMLAWKKPKMDRRTMINGILQIPACFVFCFRAKSVVKPVKLNGKTEIVPQGFIPISGDEITFEMTLNCLLLPHSNGVPTWVSENPGERMAMKLPVQFRTMFADPKTQLSRSMGKQLAEWAGGKKAEPVDRDKLLAIGGEKATGGLDTLKAWWTSLRADERVALKDDLPRLKEQATKPAPKPEDDFDSVPMPLNDEQKADIEVAELAATVIEKFTTSVNSLEFAAAESAYHDAEMNLGKELNRVKAVMAECRQRLGLEPKKKETARDVRRRGVAGDDGRRS